MPVIDLIRGNNAYREVSPGEFAGPCPGCGGALRLRIWPEQDRYACVHCKQGGTIAELSRILAPSERLASGNTVNRDFYRSGVCELVSEGGIKYHITDNRAAYDRLVFAGEIVFDSAEIGLVIRSGADKKQAALILSAKKTFPGVRVSDALLDDHGATHSEPSPRYRGKFARTGTGS